MMVAFLKKYAKSLLDREVCDDTPISMSSFPFFLTKPSSTPLPSTEAQITKIETSLIERSLETVLSEGAFVKGELKFHKVIRIDGSFEGDLSSKGKLIVGPKGFVRAHICLDEAVIQGKVIGSITVKKLTLLASAEVIGDIKAEVLSMDPGAKISGHISIGMDDNLDNAYIYLDKDLDLEPELQISC